MFRHACCLLLVPVFAAALRGEGAARNSVPADAAAILRNAETLVLYSLNPDRAEKKSKTVFHGWEVLGKTEVKDADTRKKLVEALIKGVEEYKGSAAKCFDPRHGIRATRGGQTADFVICFECYQVQVSVDGERKPTVLVSRSPAAAFNAVLKKAGVPLPRQK